MTWTPRRSLRQAAFYAAALALLVVGQSRATTVNSTIALGGAGNTGTFSGTVSLGSGSQIQLGAGAIAGNYKQHALFLNTNIGFSAQNESANLSLSPSSISVSTSSNQGTANLTYDNVTPGAPETLNSFSSVLSDGVVKSMTINSGGLNVGTSIGTFTLTPTFSGTIKNITFQSTGTADVTGGGNLIDGNYSVTLNGSVTGVLNVLGINISVGTLYTLDPDTVVSFAGSLPIGVTLADTGLPYGGGLTTVDRNTMMASFGADLSSLPALPFAFIAPLSTNTSFSVGSSSSGVTSIRIQNSTLIANLNLSNVIFNETGKVANALIPEPSSLLLGGMSLVGFIGLIARHRKVVG
ncbi:MAG TPA: hypothetical protein VGJ26_17800 [Pirellulales bacterium]